MSNYLVNILSVYGKVPLFYFLTHFFLIHFFMLGLMFWQGFRWSEMDFAAGNFGRPKGVPSGVELGLIYLIWLGVVIILYRPGLWFGKFKQENKQWFLKYI